MNKKITAGVYPYPQNNWAIVNRLAITTNSESTKKICRMEFRTGQSLDHQLDMGDLIKFLNSGRSPFLRMDRDQHNKAVDMMNNGWAFTFSGKGRGGATKTVAIGPGNIGC